MKKRFFKVNIHSISDLITNSSSEVFIISLDKVDKTLKNVFKVICKNMTNSDHSIKKFTDDPSRVKEYIIPDGLDINKLYYVNIDQNDYTLDGIIKDLFEVVDLEYKD